MATSPQPLSSQQQRVHWAEGGELAKVTIVQSQSPVPSDCSNSSDSDQNTINNKQQLWHRLHNPSSSSSENESPSPSQSSRSPPCSPAPLHINVGLRASSDSNATTNLLVGECKHPLQQYHPLSDTTRYASPTPTSSSAGRDPIRALMATSDEEQRKLICRELFDSLDYASCGYLSRDEMRLALPRLDIEASNEQLNAIMSVLDPDGDDRISFEDFFNGFMQLAGDIDPNAEMPPVVEEDETEDVHAQSHARASPSVLSDMTINSTQTDPTGAGSTPIMSRSPTTSTMGGTPGHRKNKSSLAFAHPLKRRASQAMLHMMRRASVDPNVHAAAAAAATAAGKVTPSASASGSNYSIRLEQTILESEERSQSPPISGAGVHLGSLQGSGPAASPAPSTSSSVSSNSSASHQSRRLSLSKSANEIGSNKPSASMVKSAARSNHDDAPLSSRTTSERSGASKLSNKLGSALEAPQPSRLRSRSAGSAGPRGKDDAAAAGLGMGSDRQLGKLVADSRNDPEAHEEVASLAQALHRQRATSIITSQRLEKMRDGIRDAEEENVRLIATQASLQSQLKALQSDYNDLKFQHKNDSATWLAATERLPTLEKQVLEAQQELENTRAMLQVERKNKRSLQQEADSLSAQLAAFKQQQSRRHTTASNASPDMIKSLQAQLKQMTELENMNQELQMQIEAGERDREEQNRLIESLREAVGTLEVELREARISLEQRSELHGRRTSMSGSESLGGATSRLAAEEFKQKMEEEAAKRATLESQLSLLQHKLDDSQSNQAKYADEIKKANELAESYKSQLESKNARVRELEQKLEAQANAQSAAAADQQRQRDTWKLRETELLAQVAQMAVLNERLAQRDRENKEARDALEAMTKLRTEEGLAATKERARFTADMEQQLAALKSELESQREIVRQLHDAHRKVEQKLEETSAIPPKITLHQGVQCNLGDDQRKLELEAEAAEKERLQTRITELEKRVAELESELAHYKELEQRHAEEEEARRQHEADEARLRALQAERERLEREAKEIADREREEQARLAREKAELEEKQRQEAAAATALAAAESANSVPQIHIEPGLDDELIAYARYFNGCLAGDAELTRLGLLPIQPHAADLLSKLRGGILLAKFINCAAPDTIDERALNLPAAKNALMPSAKILENLNLVLSAASSIGLRVKSIGLGAVQLLDPLAEEHHAVIGEFLWLLVRTKLLAPVSLKVHPELTKIVGDGGQSNPLVRSGSASNVSRGNAAAIPPQELLLRWLNHHLKQFGMKASNLQGDLASGELYLALIHSIQFFEKHGHHAAPLTGGNSVAASPSLQSLNEAFRSSQSNLHVGSAVEIKSSSAADAKRKAEEVLHQCAQLDIATYDMIQSHHLHSAHAKFNLALMALIFAAHPALPELTEQENSEIEKAVLMTDDVGASREERAFRMWMNSCGLDRYVHFLFSDCRDGIALLQMIDHIQPGCVSWKNVELKPSNKFQCISNCNYVIKLAKEKLQLSLVGIGGSDLYDMNKMYVLSLVWQLMRYHTVQFLRQLNSRVGAHHGGSSDTHTDDYILKWANERVSSKGRKSQMASFRDKSLSTSLFFLDLLWSIEPRIIDWNLVTPGTNEKACLLNAAYTISVARKLGATVFLLPEDIYEVKPKMILTLVASIMAICASDNDIPLGHARNASSSSASGMGGLTRSDSKIGAGSSMSLISVPSHISEDSVSELETVPSAAASSHASSSAMLASRRRASTMSGSSGSYSKLP